MPSDHPLINERLDSTKLLRLFLDYDGTLDDFAPTPECINPNLEVISMLAKLAEDERIHIAVISGRRLSHIKKLIPIPGIMLAGTYGIELQTPEGERINRDDKSKMRPLLAALKLQWKELINSKKGFFLEDKGWTLAIHARFAEEHIAKEVLAAAKSEAVALIGSSSLRLRSGHKFLEIGPKLANKGSTVNYLLQRYPSSQALLIYLGDDDKDEEAFSVIKACGGIAIQVASEPRDTLADWRLESPRAARRWLESLPRRLGKR